MAAFIKDPQSVLDYKHDWTLWLKGDTIATAITWTVAGPDSALIVDSVVSTAATTVVWLSGGTLGETYVITSHIETQLGRIDERSDELIIKQR